MIEIVTFTGVDVMTDFERLEDLSQQYPWAEFGILVGTQTGKDHPIFPPLEIVDVLRTVLPAERVAVHLCGRYARESMAPLRLFDVFGVTAGFGRIQVNLHGDEYDPSQIVPTAESLTSMAKHADAHTIIVQHRGDWDTVPVQHPRVEYLFDRSEGSGQEGFQHWPAPPDHMRVGYAGGIGPHNISKAIAFAERHRERPIWLDMERNVRTDDYWLDLNLVEKVCRKVDEAGIASTNGRKSE